MVPDFEWMRSDTGKGKLHGLGLGKEWVGGVFGTCITMSRFEHAQLIIYPYLRSYLFLNLIL